MKLTKRALSVGALSLALMVGGSTVAAADTSGAEGTQAAEAAGIEMIETLDPESISTINEEIATAGGKQLPADTVAFGFNDAGDAVAVNGDGEETLLESADVMDAEIAAAEPAGGAEGAVTTAAETADKGVLTGAAATIAGCVGGVVGYDQILEILERRASYWTVVKFLAKKVGPGLAISCIAGAGGALATYLGW